MLVNEKGAPNHLVLPITFQGRHELVDCIAFHD
jgi:hypothetical protein